MSENEVEKKLFVYICQIFMIDVKYLTFFYVSDGKKPVNFKAL